MERRGAEVPQRRGEEDEADDEGEGGDEEGGRAESAHVHESFRTTAPRSWRLNGQDKKVKTFNNILNHLLKF